MADICVECLGLLSFHVILRQKTMKDKQQIKLQKIQNCSKEHEKLKNYNHKILQSPSLINQFFILHAHYHFQIMV
jgi:hypothetical protein